MTLLYGFLSAISSLLISWLSFIPLSWMKIFDNGNILNKNNNEKLYRNFSGIIKNDSAKNINNADNRFNNYEENNNFHKVLTNRFI